jgi:hypothetical protein
MRLKRRRISMNNLAITTGLALLLTTAYTLSEPLTPEQCQEVWNKAVPTGDVLAEKDAKPYIVDFKLADLDKDGTVDRKEFEAACAKGLVTYTKSH